ncbi:MAG: dephospho-CoA kinase [Ruminococcus sp.]|jgi:dephospho-CoA kinase|nr:dephospho-CoA kinase [Ruminococcus sp.]
MIHVIGLTGQSGAGKTTAGAVFKSCGFAVIDADECSREAVLPRTDCLKEISEYFGRKIINPDGTLNRPALASIVFSEKSELKKLNAIIHPYITSIICKKINEYKTLGKDFIILDAPTLFESNTDDLCDLIISVTAKEELRKKRIFERDSLSEEDISMRFRSQYSESFFRKHSDFIIINNKSEDEFIEKTKEVAEKIKAYYSPGKTLLNLN